MIPHIISHFANLDSKTRRELSLAAHFRLGFRRVIKDGAAQLQIASLLNSIRFKLNPD